ERDLQVARRDQRAIDGDGRPDVAAHGVYGDAHLSGQSRPLLLDGLDLSPAVVAAGRTDNVGRLGLVALRTLAAADRLQRVVRAALGGAGLRVPAFWIRHDVT